MNGSKTKPLIFATAITCLAVSLLVGMRGFSPQDVVFSVHATARVAFGFFLAVYFARSLRSIFGVTWLLINRRTLGLCVALALTVHFGFLVAFFSLAAESVFDDLVRLYTGSLGVIALYSMAATSNSAAVRAMGPWWKRLHRFGIHYLWVFFFASYLLAAQKEPSLLTPAALTFCAFLLILLLGVVLRVAIWMRRPAQRITALDPG